MAIDTTSPTSRRTLLAGAIAAAAAASLGRAQPASAHDADDVRLGASNLAASQTTIVRQSGSAFSGVASGSGAGVFGSSAPGIGVIGNSGSGNGVYGHTSSAVASGVYGQNKHKGYGVAGRSNAGPFGGAAATLGENTADGIGVWARSAHGIALFADPVNSDAIAIRAQGVAQFMRSGKLTVKAGKSAVTKTGIRIDAGTLVLATLQQDRPGVYVRSAVPNAAGDSFTIRLSEVVASDTKVGWFLVN